MKKILPMLLIILVLLVSLCACNKQAEPTVIKESDTYIVLAPTNDFAAKPLIQFMEKAKNDGTLDFKVENHMITSINGIDNPSDFSYCWMLYTSDAEHSDTSYLTIDYKGNVYGLTLKGAEEQIIVEGAIYIWVYTKF